MSSQFDAALETVLTAARQFAEVIADDEGKSREDAQAEREIWDALEIFGAARIDPFVACEQAEPIDPDAEHGAAPVHEVEHVTSALSDDALADGDVDLILEALQALIERNADFAADGVADCVTENEAALNLIVRLRRRRS